MGPRDYSSTTFSLKGQKLILHPYKVILWRERNILIISDLHLGKANHFRSQGIPVPSQAESENLARIMRLIMDFSPSEVIFLGDLFHSTYNESWKSFTNLLDQFSSIKFHLVMGNHDILPDEVYDNSPMEIHTEKLDMQPFSFSHYRLDDREFYNFSGHIHPSVILKGKARQSLRLPCFYFGKKYGVMPAFGVFTGFSKIKVKEGDQVYVIANKKVVCVTKE